MKIENIGNIEIGSHLKIVAPHIGALSDEPFTAYYLTFTGFTKTLDGKQALQFVYTDCKIGNGITFPKTAIEKLIQMGNISRCSKS